MAQQVWSVNSLGGYLANNKLSEKIRVAAQPMQKFRQFTSPMESSGAGQGEYVLFDKISNVATAGGALTETSTIPKTNFTITQGSLQILEYGNSIPYTLKAQTLAQVSISDQVSVALRNDMAKVLDSAAAAQYTAADYKATAVNTATTTFGTASAALATSTANMSDKNVRDVIDKMKILNIPRFDGNNYVCIASTNSIRGLYDFFEAKAENTTMSPLMAGEVGTYYGTRFVEETNFLSNTLGSGSVFGEAVFFGDDAVKEGIALAEHLRIDSNDFGRDQGVAWLYMGGFKKIWDFGDDGETHIIHLTSL